MEANDHVKLIKVLLYNNQFLNPRLVIHLTRLEISVAQVDL